MSATATPQLPPHLLPPHAALQGRIACPLCHGELARSGDRITCTACGSPHRVVDGILDLAPPMDIPKEEEEAWLRHWSEGNQQSAAQRFFSFYRKAIFARTVRHFTSKFFPEKGVFLEAGSGTAETSSLIPKSGGRTLLALDLVLPVLQRVHPCMDIRVRGDIFRLPFHDNSLDGIWNVGVMEHFLHPQIDAILREFHRVLKPGGRVILLWPATFSIPQRMLRVVEFFVNLRNKGRKFQFHPDEISQIRSIREGREVLTRNQFHPVSIDPGFYSLMAFETIVGEKRTADKTSSQKGKAR